MAWERAVHSHNPSLRMNLPTGLSGQAVYQRSVIAKVYVGWLQLRPSAYLEALGDARYHWASTLRDRGCGANDSIEALRQARTPVRENESDASRQSRW